MAKRKFDTDEYKTEIYGYIQSASDLKQASSGTRYFDGLVQTSESEFLRFVSFR